MVTIRRNWYTKIRASNLYLLQIKKASLLLKHQTSSFPIISHWVNHDEDKHVHIKKDDCNGQTEWWVNDEISKIIESIKRCSFIGVRIISIVFHCFEQVVPIVDGPFFGIVSIINVHCLQDVISFVVDVENQEKTCTRQPSSQEVGPSYGYPEESRTEIGGIRGWLVQFYVHQEQMPETHLQKQTNFLSLKRSKWLFFLTNTKHRTSRQRLRTQLARSAQPQEIFSTHFLIVKISSFKVFLSWFTMESP